MRSLGYFSIMMVMSAVSTAYAEEGRYSQTLDEQRQRVQEGQPAVPNEWPASASAAQMSAAAPAAGPGDFSRKHGEVTMLGSGAIPALPLQAMTNGEITYINGGIGDEEERQLRMQAHDYNLRMLITAASGEYLSNVIVRVMDSTGTELARVADAGPYLYMHLKPGKYRVEATSPGGNVRKFNASIPASGAVKQHITFNE